MEKLIKELMVEIFIRNVKGNILIKMGLAIEEIGQIIKKMEKVSYSLMELNMVLKSKKINWKKSNNFSK